MKRLLLAFLITVSLCSGVVVADTVHEWSFERDISEEWEITSEIGGNVSQSEERQTHGYYSLAWDDTNAADYQFTRMRTIEADYISADHTVIEFDYYQNTTNGDYDEMSVVVATPEQDIILYTEAAGSNVAFVGGQKASYVETSQPPNNQWNHVRMEIEGTEVTTTINNETLTSTMDTPIQEPEKAKIAIEFYNSGFDSAGDSYYIDGLMVSQPTPELVSYDMTSIVFVFAIIGLFFLVGIRLYSVATIVLTAVTCMAAIGVMVFETTESALWISMILTILVIILSAANFYSSA